LRGFLAGPSILPLAGSQDKLKPRPFRSSYYEMTSTRSNAPALPVLVWKARGGGLGSRRGRSGAGALDALAPNYPAEASASIADTRPSCCAERRWRSGFNLLPALRICWSTSGNFLHDALADGDS